MRHFFEEYWGKGSLSFYSFSSRHRDFRGDTRSGANPDPFLLMMSQADKTCSYPPLIMRPIDGCIRVLGREVRHSVRNLTPPSLPTQNR